MLPDLESLILEINTKHDIFSVHAAAYKLRDTLLAPYSDVQKKRERRWARRQRRRAVVALVDKAFSWIVSDSAPDMADIVSASTLTYILKRGYSEKKSRAEKDYDIAAARGAGRSVVLRLCSSKYFRSVHPVARFFGRLSSLHRTIWADGSLASVGITEIILLAVRLTKVSLHVQSEATSYSEKELQYCTILLGLIYNSHPNICGTVLCLEMPTHTRRKLLELICLTIRRDSTRTSKLETARLVYNFIQLYTTYADSLKEWFSIISKKDLDNYTEFIRDSKSCRGHRGLLDRETLKTIITITIRLITACIPPPHSFHETEALCDGPLSENLCFIINTADRFPDELLHSYLISLCCTHDDYLFSVLESLARLFICINSSESATPYSRIRWYASLRRLFRPGLGLLEPEGLFAQMVAQVSDRNGSLLHATCILGNPKCLQYLLVFFKTILLFKLAPKMRIRTILRKLHKKLLLSSSNLGFNIVPLTSLLSSVLNSLPSE